MATLNRWEKTSLILKVMVPLRSGLFVGSVTSAKQTLVRDNSVVFFRDACNAI